MASTVLYEWKLVNYILDRKWVLYKTGNKYFTGKKMNTLLDRNQYIIRQKIITLLDKKWVVN